MAYGQIDPAQLDGDALTQWYLRSPDEIEQERQEAAAQRYRDFFGGNGGADQGPGLDAGFATPTQDIDPGLDGGYEASAKDTDPGFSWVQVGPDRWSSVSSASTDPSSNLGTDDSVSSDSAAFGRSYGDASAGGETHVAVAGAFRPRARVAAVSAPSSAVSASPAPGVAPAPRDQSLASSPAPAAFSPRFGGAAPNPVTALTDAFHDWQHGPKMQRPNLAESFIPVVGPAWEAAADLQDGNYGGAAFNGVMAVADALPIGVAAKGIKAASKGIGILKDGSVTADAARKMLRARGLARPGEEVHHTIPLDGLGRNVQDWRNHFAFLKPLPKEIHRRLTGSWMGKPEFDPIRKIWYGTTDWQKAVPTGVAGYATDAWENLTHPVGSVAGGPSNPRGRP
jgi:hypothetical protein